MRAIVATRPGGPEVLEVVEIPDPTPADDEVVIDVAATAVNRADTLQRQGNYPPPPGEPLLIGLECSGTITAVGAAVEGWQVGDQVCALLAGGGYAEKVAVPAGQLLPIPAGVSLIEAAALPEATCTVWSMTFGENAGRLRSSERFLVHGGTSGIGTIAIQIAHARGATVYATAGTDEKVAATRELGADIAINYRNESFEGVIDYETGGKGVDVVLDNMGASYLARNLESLAIGGRLIVLGLQGGAAAKVDLRALLKKRATIHAAGLRARPRSEKAEIVADTKKNVWPLIESGAVRPVIDRVLTLDDAADAHRLLESSEHIGKVVMRIQ